MAERVRTRSATLRYTQPTEPRQVVRAVGRRRHNRRTGAEAEDTGERQSADPSQDATDQFVAGSRRQRDEAPEQSGGSTSIAIRPAAVGKSPARYSGTTARTSLTPVQGGATANTQSMIFTLAPMDDAAARIIFVLTPSTPSINALARPAKAFTNRSRSAGRTLAASLTQFHESREVYGNEPFINVSKIVLAMLPFAEGHSLSAGPWRPDDILFRANLAIAAEDVQTYLLHHGAYGLPLEKLDRDFPEPFLHSVVPTTGREPLTCGVSFLLKETFEVALAIRIQLAIYTLTQENLPSDHDPDLVLRSIFHGDSTCRGWDAKGLRAHDLSQAQKLKIVEASDNIQAHVRSITLRQENGEQISMQELQVAFPMEECVLQYLLWIRSRDAEIESYLTTVGKVIGIQEAIEEQEMSWDSSHSPQTTRQDTTTSVSKTLSSLSPAGRANAWKKATRNSPLGAPRRPSNLRRTVNASPELDALNPQLSVERRRDDDEQSSPSIADDTLESNPRLSALQVESMVTKARHDITEADKENAGPEKLTKRVRTTKHFIDPQEDAERVEFDEIQSGDASNRNRGVDDADKGESSEPSQDGGFQQDSRTTDKRNKRVATVSYDAPPPKRPRHTLHAGESALPDPPSVGAGPSQPSQAGASADRRSQYNNVNEEAKAQAQIFNSSKRPQSRRPWTENETNYFQEQIETIGISWSRIKTNDTEGILRNRDQVALKDKARNMLFDYLKSRRNLPRNFQFISLNKIQKSQLESMAIPYVGSDRTAIE